MSRSVLFISMLALYPLRASPPLEQTFTRLTSALARTGRSHLPPARFNMQCGTSCCRSAGVEVKVGPGIAGSRGNGAAGEPASIRSAGGNPRGAVAQGHCHFHRTTPSIKSLLFNPYNRPELLHIQAGTFSFLIAEMIALIAVDVE